MGIRHNGRGGIAAIAQQLATGAMVCVEADGATEDSVFVATQAKLEVD